jgi:protoporphyrinogen oxidase
VSTLADDKFLTIAPQDIAPTGLLAGARVEDRKLLRLPPSYFLYPKDYKRHLIPCFKCLSISGGLQVTGRYRGSEHKNNFHSVLSAENVTTHAATTSFIPAHFHP